MTGQADFLLIVLVKSMEDYDAFARRAPLGDDNVKGFVTTVVMDRVKTGVTVPLGELVAERRR